MLLFRNYKRLVPMEHSSYSCSLFVDFGICVDFRLYHVYYDCYLHPLVWRHLNGRRWPVNFKILPGFRTPLNWSFNMKSCRAIWQFIPKNKSYGFIVLYKTINVIIQILHKILNNVTVYIKTFSLTICVYLSFILV
jgi:hypothetical protein